MPCHYAPLYPSIYLSLYLFLSLSLSFSHSLSLSLSLAEEGSPSPTGRTSSNIHLWQPDTVRRNTHTHPLGSPNRTSNAAVHIETEISV